MRSNLFWELRSELWEFLTELSGHPISSSPKVKNLEFSKWGTDRLSRNVGKELPIYAAEFFQKSSDLIYTLLFKYLIILLSKLIGRE